MTVPAFEIFEFGEGSFFRALSNRHLAASEVEKHDRARYLYGYLQYLKARTIVLEPKYTDGDYLDDFAAYYVKCWQDYERRCNRLHFFSAEITSNQFLGLISGQLDREESSTIIAQYLGFIVARPLPDAIIGRTILRPYPDDGGRRHYDVVRPYNAHLFGVDLPIKSLAFEEQDTVLAACATVALWSCFHKCSELFDTTCPTPAVITRAANQVVHPGRPIPSHGLNVQQICNAIRHIGLDPEVVQIRDNTPLISLIYAHLKMGLPVLLGLEVEGRGLHAVTVAGYSQRPAAQLKQEVAAGKRSLPMIGLRIDELYAHDDQIGPFSRLRVQPSATDKNRVFPVSFEGSWIDKATGKALRLYPVVAVIPVYHKIRLNFLDVQQWLTRLHSMFSIIIQPGDGIEWDVHLITTNEYKRQLKSENCLSLNTTKELLLRQQPRFMWRSLARINGKPAIELLADATDMARSLPICEVIWHSADFRNLMKSVLDMKTLTPLLTRTLTEPFKRFLVEKTKDL